MLPLDCRADRAHVGVGVGVEQLQEEREVLRIALVRRRGQQQHVIGAVAQQLAESVASSLARGRRPRHAVRLVDDDEIPMDLTQPGEDILPFG